MRIRRLAAARMMYTGQHPRAAPQPVLPCPQLTDHPHPAGGAGSPHFTVREGRLTEVRDQLKGPGKRLGKLGFRPRLGWGSQACPRPPPRTGWSVGQAPGQHCPFVSWGIVPGKGLGSHERPPHAGFSGYWELYPSSDPDGASASPPAPHPSASLPTP